jgi:hypothetical protein
VETAAGCLPKPYYEWTLIRKNIFCSHKKIDKNPVFHPQVTKSRNSSTHQKNRTRSTQKTDTPTRGDPRIQTHPSGVTVRYCKIRIVHSFGTNNSGGKVADTSLGRNVTMNKCVQLEGRINKCTRVTIICLTHT